MALQQSIAGSYGEQDGIFAGHPNDKERARQAIQDANAEGVGWAEYLERHQAFLAGRGWNDNHINEQIERVKNLEKYWDLD